MPNIRTAAKVAASSALSTTPAAPVSTLTLPETGFLRQPQVLAFVPISKSTLWRRIQARTFPEPVKLSERVTVWRAEDIRRWIAQQGQPGWWARQRRETGSAQNGGGVRGSAGPARTRHMGSRVLQSPVGPASASANAERSA